MDQKKIEQLAELIDWLGSEGRSAAVALSAELMTYPDRTHMDEGLAWMSFSITTKNSFSSLGPVF